MSMFYIYTLSDPRDNTVRYVGCTKNAKRRLTAHLTAKPKKPDAKQLWINELKSQNLAPDFSVVDQCDSVEMATELEQIHYGQHKQNELLFGGNPAIYNYASSAGSGNDVNLQLRLPVDLHDKLKALAKKNGLTPSAYLRMLIAIQEQKS